MFARSTLRFYHGEKIFLSNISGVNSKLKVIYRNVKKSPVKPPCKVNQTVWGKLFGKYLLATNIISSGILMVFGDFIVQEVEYRKDHNIHRLAKLKILDLFDEERYDLFRLGRMFIVGALQGPLHHYVYLWMDRKMPVATLKTTIKKILIDQFFMSPICIMLFFYSACYLENHTLKETNEELLDKIGIIYLGDWLFWPGAQFVNFHYLQSKYRVMFVNVCTALYNVFMSYMKHDYHAKSST